MNFRLRNDWGDLKTGSLVLGGSSLFASWVLPGLIGRFSARYPKVHVELVEESTAELARLLQQGRIDMMLDNCRAGSPTFRSRRLSRRNSVSGRTP